MTAWRALTDGFCGGLRFRGRMGRAAYLVFLASAILLLCLGTWLLAAPAGGAWRAFAALVLLLYLPVTAAGVRRLHDAGQPGTLMLQPLVPAAMLTLLCVLLLVVLSHVPPLAAAHAVVTLLFPGVYIALAAAALLVTLAATLIFFSDTMGKLLLPSRPDPVFYGPNRLR